MDRITMCVRQITRRRRREFLQWAKLFEAGVRNLAMFSSRSKEAAKAASEIKLVTEKPLRRQEDETTSTGQRTSPGGVVLPSGYRHLEERTPVPTSTAEEIPMRSRHIEFTTDDLPDAEGRVKRTDVAEDDLNKEGSFEAMLGLMGRMTQTG